MRMILLCALFVALLGTTLYQVKTGIDQREARLMVLTGQIEETRRDIAVLEAEWAYLSRPERVMDLSNRLLGMKPIGTDRILPIDAIPMRIIPQFSETAAQPRQNPAGEHKDTVPVLGLITKTGARIEAGQ